MSADLLRNLAYAKAAFQLRAIEAIISAPASADTHPKDGDVKQAPLVSGAVPKADAQNTPSAHPSGEQTND